MRWLVLPILLVASLSLSGCTEGCSAPFWASDVPENQPSVLRAGPEEVLVRVIDPLGAAIPGAGVIVFWIDNEGADGSIPDPAHVKTLRMRADEVGMAVAGVPADKTIHVSAGLDGWTTEWFLGAGRGSQTVDLTLYPENPSIEWTVPLDDVAHVGTANAKFYPTPLAFAPGASQDVNQGYLERMQSVTASIAWVNEPTAAADLGIGLSVDGDSFRYRNEASQATLGAHAETWRVSRDDAEQFDYREPKSFHVGPSVSTASLTPFGMDVLVLVEAELEETRAVPQLCKLVGSRDVTIDDPPPSGKEQKEPASQTGAAQDPPPKAEPRSDRPSEESGRVTEGSSDSSGNQPDGSAPVHATSPSEAAASNVGLGGSIFIGVLGVVLIGGAVFAFVSSRRTR